MSASKDSKIVALGKLIELCDERNSMGSYGIEDVMGMTITKEIIPTKADVKDADLTKYLIVKPLEFVYNPRTHGKKIGLGYNKTEKPFLISWNNIAFRVKDSKILDSDYLYMYLNRQEWDRNACFCSWGSSTEVFSWTEFCLMTIPLPSVEVQRELVSIYTGLKSLAEENEALLQPLSEACHAFIVDCKAKYPSVKLGEFIEEINDKNINGEISLTQGVDVNMQFITAKREANDKESTKIVRTGQFAFNKVVKANRTKLPIALRKGPDCIISGSYAVFTITKPNVLLADFLMLFISRSEFHRYCGYISHGTTRDVFDFSNLCKVDIPIPPLSVQQKVVDLYNCYEEAKKIATQAREQLKTICPALVQKAAHIV